jgi:signal transduction histidine kinase
VRVETWLNTAYFATWIGCAFPGLLNIQSRRVTGWQAIVWLASFVAFTAALVVYRTRVSTPRTRRAAVLLVTTQALSGFVMVVLSIGMSRYTSAFALVFVTGELPDVVSNGAAWVWIACQSAVLLPLFWWSDGWVAMLSAGGAFAGTYVFTLGQAFLARSERAARDALARTNAELNATRELLAENSRSAERLRISRDLHDALGHHLTALSIQLDVASRRTEGPAAEHILQAHAITRLLLSDVRDVVGRLRGSGRVNLTGMLRPLAASVGDLGVHFEISDDVSLDDAGQAHTILRSVQEIITNAARHANARNVWVAIAMEADGLHLHAHDDGGGAARVILGDGLTGMRERFEQFAGRVEFATAPGKGFEIRAFLPEAPAAR